MCMVVSIFTSAMMVRFTPSLPVVPICGIVAIIGFRPSRAVVSGLSSDRVLTIERGLPIMSNVANDTVVAVCKVWLDGSDDAGWYVLAENAVDADFDGLTEIYGYTGWVLPGDFEGRIERAGRGDHSGLQRWADRAAANDFAGRIEAAGCIDLDDYWGCVGYAPVSEDADYAGDDAYAECAGCPSRNNNAGCSFCALNCD